MMHIHQNIIPEDIANKAEGSVLTKDEISFITEYLNRHPTIKKLSRKRMPFLRLTEGKGANAKTRSMHLRFSIIRTENNTPFLLYTGKKKLGKVRALGAGAPCQSKIRPKYPNQ